MSNESSEVVFNPFDYEAEVQQSQRFLPHWFQPGVTVFVTFRTADSMPKAVIERWQREQEEWLVQHGLDVSVATEIALSNNLPLAQRREFRRMRDRLWHRSLDDCHGECLLRQSNLARIVGDALLHFDGIRYDVDSFVVMPNHVHLLVQFRPPAALVTQSESWLRFSARKMNKHLNRKGAFWQPEPFDHLVRSSDQFIYLREYIADNPKKAKIKEGEYLYWSRPIVARLSES